MGWGLLSLIPHLIKQSRAGGCGGVGVAGWNIALLVRTCACGDAGGLGTLLGPEETPGCRVFLVPLLVLSSNVSLACCGWVWWRWWVGVWLCVECCIVDASILCGQVCKGTLWMSGHQEPMKDVGGRDSPRGVVNRAVIRGCPNGETRRVSGRVTRA